MNRLAVLILSQIATGHPSDRGDERHSHRQLLRSFLAEHETGTYGRYTRMTSAALLVAGIHSAVFLKSLCSLAQGLIPTGGRDGASHRLLGSQMEDPGVTQWVKGSLEERCLLECYAVWLLQEPHGVIFQKTPFFIVIAMTTSYLTKGSLSCMVKRP
jgi:hypothetical protein